MADSIHGDSNNSGEIMRRDSGATLVIKKSLLTLKGDSGED